MQQWKNKLMQEDANAGANGPEDDTVSNNSASLSNYSQKNKSENPFLNISKQTT